MKKILFQSLTFFTNSLVWILNRFHFGGTALPGLWVERYAPGLVGQYAHLYDHIILITGTNGKTTTQLSLKHVLEGNGFTVTSNSSGSNMFRGIATVLLKAGVPKKISGKETTLLCEVEEATMPVITRYVKPDVIVITNFFRDQLDAYGEVDKTAHYVREACIHSPNAILVVNEDDPKVRSSVADLTQKKIGYSLGSYATHFQYEATHTQPLNLDGEIVAAESTVKDDFSSETHVQDVAKRQEFILHFHPPGLFNVYNALAAYAVCQILGVADEAIRLGLESVQAPFGRGESVIVENNGRKIELHIFLVKNPAGFSQVWSLFGNLNDEFNLVVGLNDRIADGRDVSWIWDVPLENLSSPRSPHKLYFMGTRAPDMALRFKYASVIGIDEHVISNISDCVDDVIQKSHDGQKYHILATYTAMNEFRSALGRYVTLSKYST